MSLRIISCNITLKPGSNAAQMCLFNATVWFSKCEMWRLEPTLAVHLREQKRFTKEKCTLRCYFPSSSSTRGIKKNKKIYPYVINYLHPNTPWEHHKKNSFSISQFASCLTCKTFPFSNININTIIHFFSILWLLTAIIFYL